MKWVTVALEVPITEIDFSDCGDGCGEIHGLKCAKFGGHPILDFPDDKAPAHRAMIDYLGESATASHDLCSKSRASRMAEIIHEGREVVLNDPLAKARDGGMV